MADGFEVPIRKGLTSPLLIGGVPRGLFFINLIISVDLILLLHNWYLIPVPVLLHVLMVTLTKRDEEFFPILSRHIKAPDHLEP